MSNMFYKACYFNKSINSWNVSNVTNMSNMFNRSFRFNKPLNKWNVANVTNDHCMFRHTNIEKKKLPYLWRKKYNNF